MILYISLIAMTLIGAFASLALKKGCTNLCIKTIYKNLWIHIGGLLYLSTAFINIILLKYLDYTVVLPFTSLTYVWSAILAFVFLKEKIFGKQKLGLAMIVCGAFLLVVN